MARNEQDTPAASLTFEQLKELLAAKSGGVSTEQIAEIAAAAAVKAKKPENPQPTGISVYNPTGGPKADLKCRMFIGGCPIEKVTCTPEEIEALNRMVPGAYRVTLPDGGTKVIEVRGQLNANQALERLWIVIHPEDPDKGNFGRLAALVDQFTDANRIQVVAA